MIEIPRNPEIITPIYGVFLFIRDENGYTLMMTNRVTKKETQKVTGQLTTPAETVNGRDNLRVQTLYRAIKEEVGTISQINSIKSLGFVKMELNTPIRLAAFEIKTIRSSVFFNPLDVEEVAHPQWIPLEEIGQQKISVGNYQVPLYRSPIPEFAQNIRSVEANKSFPLVQHVGPTIPIELYDQLKNNSGT